MKTLEVLEIFIILGSGIGRRLLGQLGYNFRFDFRWRICFFFIY